MPRIKNLLINIGLFLASLLVSFFILEGVTRIFIPERNLQPHKGIAVADGRGDTVFQKNIDARLPSPELPDPVHVKTNAEGFIGRDYAVEKPAGALRFAFLGDSFVEAMQVNYEQTFAYLLEKSLNDGTSAPVAWRTCMRRNTNSSVARSR